GRVVQIAAGDQSTCALLDGGNVRCWGLGGVLGYGNFNSVGDNEVPATVGDVNVGGTGMGIATRGHTCAVVGVGSVRCWGDGAFGELGYANTRNIGDDETPASAGDVFVGSKVVSIAVGVFHTCAILDNGKVRCWGQGGAELGYANTDEIGDDES